MILRIPAEPAVSASKTIYLDMVAGKASGALELFGEDMP
jgi:hypothetical protein